MLAVKLVMTVDQGGGHSGGGVEDDTGDAKGWNLWSDDYNEGYDD